MTITSFSFLVLLGLGMILYYILPKSWQWVELLLISITFYCFATVPTTIIYLILSVVTAYVSTNIIEYFENKPHGSIILRISTIAAISFNVGLWFILKAQGIWLPILYRLGGTDFLNISMAVGALGMGYYTLQIIGYILDCYWKTIKPQKNIAKLFLFTAFFPQLITGPISRYEQLESLFEKHSFSYENITKGAQRILWGFLKKLVLAERVGIIVNHIWSNLPEYPGVFRWIAFLLYPLQMYADFSGCMDIVIGAAQIFDIHLSENFNNPFFARTVQEFWRRWHITLGTWAKDYVLYPLLKCKSMVKLGKLTKKRLGKKLGKFIPTAIGMFALWMVMGIWHGGFNYIIGVSLWYWAILMLGEWFEPLAKKITQSMNINVNSFSWHLFQSVRTYLIYAVGATFFRAEELKEAIAFLASLGQLFTSSAFNPWVLFNGSIVNTGVSFADINLIIFSTGLLIVVGILREKYGYAREWMQVQILPFRWFVWMGLFIIVLIYGMYGPGYSAVEFIYQGF
ncbi:MAG: hypothetical protein PUI46_10470 [Lachnospiraceae bacterium]|nr:hypothetical protein [Lachnospiraceae bacterium]